MTQNISTSGQYGEFPRGQTSTAGALGGPTGAGGAGGTRLPQQYRTALTSVAQAVQVCGWCADRCVGEADPNMIECIRLCEDVVELGETLLAVAPRSSRFTAEVAGTFQRAAQACADECGRHGADHCQECASVLRRAATDVRSLASTTGAAPTGAVQG